MLRRAALLSSGLTSAGVKNGIIQDDWPKFVEICQSGHAEDYYKVGDGKPLSLGSPFEDTTLCIAGFKRDIRSDGQGAANVSLIIKKGICPYGAEYAAGSWRREPIVAAQDLLNTIKQLLPSCLANSIVQVKKVCIRTKYNGGSQQNGVSQIMDSELWTPCFYELSDGEYGLSYYPGFMEAIGGIKKVDASTYWAPPASGAGVTVATTDTILSRVIIDNYVVPQDLNGSICNRDERTGSFIFGLCL